MIRAADAAGGWLWLLNVVGAAAGRAAGTCSGSQRWLRSDWIYARAAAVSTNHERLGWTRDVFWPQQCATGRWNGWLADSLLVLSNPMSDAQKMYSISSRISRPHVEVFLATRLACKVVNTRNSAIVDMYLCNMQWRDWPVEHMLTFWLDESWSTSTSMSCRPVDDYV